MVIEKVCKRDERIRLGGGKQRLKGKGGGYVKCPLLLSLLDARVRAGYVEEFQGSRSSGWWTVKSRGAIGPLSPDTCLRDWCYDGVAVQEPELQDEQTGHLTLETYGYMWYVGEESHITKQRDDIHSLVWFSEIKWSILVQLILTWKMKIFLYSVG